MSLVIRRRSLPRDGSMAALAGALCSCCSSDLIYSYQSINGGVNDTLQSCMGALAWILVAWAGYERIRNREDEGPTREITVPHLFAYLVAYVAATAGFVVLLLAATSIFDTPLGIMIIAAVAVTPLLLRARCWLCRRAAPCTS